MAWKQESTKISLILTILIAGVSICVSYLTNNILAYNDATAHLNTARRVIDNLTPGLVQLGSVWLPFLHILEIPFVFNTFLWQSGLAGAIVSGLSFITASIFLYKLVFYVTNKPLAAFLAVLTLITNVNILYLQSTAMFEPLLLALELASIYFLTKWAREFFLNDLILAAFFTMLATVTRYDGWALFIAECVVIFIITAFTKGRKKEGPVLIFLTLAGFGIAMWLLYNKMIFGDPLYFARSEYSAAAQQQILFNRGALLTKHNFILSIITYSLSVVFNNGFLVLTVAIIGLLIYLAFIFKKLYFLVPLLLLVPYGFNILSLYLGQSVIWMPQLPPHYSTYFNIRYGILMLPAVAFFVGFLAAENLYFSIGIILVILTQCYLFLFPGSFQVFGQKGIVTLNDTVSSVNSQTRHASAFLHNHYTQGLIMVSSASSDAFIFRCNIPLKNFITEGTGYYWKDSLNDPGRFATWLVFFQDRSDRVGKAMPANTLLSKTFTQVYHDQTYQIWQKKSQ